MKIMQNLFVVFVALLIAASPGLAKEVDASSVQGASEGFTYHEVMEDDEVVLDDDLTLILSDIYYYRSYFKRLLSGGKYGSVKVIFRNKGYVSGNTLNQYAYHGESSTTLRTDRELTIGAHTIQLMSVNKDSAVLGIKSEAVPDQKTKSGRIKHTVRKVVEIEKESDKEFPGIRTDGCGILLEECIVVGPEAQGSLKRFLDN